MKQLCLALIAVFAATLLNGCVPLVAIGAGAAATSGLVVYDQRDMNTIRDDNKIRNNIARQIRRDKTFKGSHIVLTSFNHVVLLAGQTPLPKLRIQAETIAKNQPLVTKVYNEIIIENPTTELTRASDGWVTTKVKTHMLAEKGLHSGAIKVLTENGTVFLMGRVNREQARIAVEIARRVGGVQKVVKAFDYTDS
jgi:osmotically-inducible protein OsmY